MKQFGGPTDPYIVFQDVASEDLRHIDDYFMRYETDKRDQPPRKEYLKGTDF
jgi:hypothetical protein